MMSMSIQVQPRVDGRFTNRPSFSFMNVSCVRPKPYFCVAGETRRPSFPSVGYRNLKFEALKRSRRVPHAAELAPAETMEDVLDAEYGEEEPEVAKVVKPMMKPRVVLKFIWMEKNIGLGLDQMIPGHGTVPLSPYFFWPRKDAWEELKTTLEAKPWISQKNMIILLNQATDIINLWQQSGGNLS